jgi:hypothetical protein
MVTPACLEAYTGSPFFLRAFEYVPHIRSMPFSSLSGCSERLTRSQDAIASLNTLQSNYAVVDAIRKSGRGMNQQAIPEMIEWCQKTGYEVDSCYHGRASLQHRWTDQIV